MVNFEKKDRYDFADLVRLVAFLRGENGCDWDRVQTHESIRRNFLEEAYEACDGMDLDDPDVMKEEFGDVLLQVVFHSGIEADRGRFTIDDVCTRVCEKMIHRHPHLFGGERSDWETLKKQEKGAKTQTDLMRGVAKSLPALIRAEKIAEKANDPALRGEVFDAEEALGDRLLQIVAAAAANGQDAETALHRAIDRYIDRFAEKERAQCDTSQSR